jgi:aminoglycoside 3-N-acetyltransferase
MKHFIKSILPKSVKNKIIKYLKDKERKAIANLPKLNEEDFKNILIDKLNLKTGDTVMVHSSLDKLNLDFPALNVLTILLSIVGDKGTLVFPTFPKKTSFEFLKTGEVFNIKRTASYTGILSEFARRSKFAIRSMHPTKSVVAIGAKAEFLTNEHFKSPYPYDKCSPYYKLIEAEAKIIGLGVKTTYLSAVHVVDDVMRDTFPINPYLSELFNAKCIDYNGNELIIPTYAHDMKKMGFDLPKYFKTQIGKSICEDININGMSFFRADAKPMLNKMIELAENGITIYSF